MKRLIWKLILTDDSVIYSNILSINTPLPDFIEYNNTRVIRDPRSAARTAKNFSQFKSVFPTDTEHKIEPAIINFLKQHNLYN